MSKRSYRQNCALAHASDLIGERWSLLLIRDLLVGPRRFNELNQSLRGMGTNLLASRLKELGAASIIERRPLGEGSHAYALTERGLALEPAILALVRWGLRYGLEGQAGFHHRNEWDLVALKALFQPKLSGRLSVRIQFKTDGFAGWMAIDEQQTSIGLGDAEKPDVVVKGTIKDLFTGPKTPEELLVFGSPTKLSQYMSSFDLPH